MVFSAVFETILAHIPEEDKEETFSEVQGYLKKLFSRSRCDPAFVACLHRICFQEGPLAVLNENTKTIDFDISPDLVGDTSFKSLNFHTGIMLLEKQILQVGALLFCYQNFF